MVVGKLADLKEGFLYLMVDILYHGVFGVEILFEYDPENHTDDA